MSTKELAVPTDEMDTEYVDEQDIFTEDKVDGLEMADGVSEAESFLYGELLDASWYYEFKSRQDTDIIYVLGDSDSGKTTFEAVIYGLLHDQVDDNLLFAGSKTLMGFETRRRYIVSGDEDPIYHIKMERTRRDGSNRIFLHLDLYSLQNDGRKTILLPDVPGEDYVSCSQKKEQISERLPLIEYASHIVLLLDAEKLVEAKEKDGVFMRACYFLQMLRAANRYRKDAIVDIVVSKADILAKASGGEDLVRNIPEEFATYEKDFKIKYFCIEAQNAIWHEFKGSEDVMIFFKYLVGDLEHTKCVTVDYDDMEKGMSDNCNLLRRRWYNE